MGSMRVKLQLITAVSLFTVCVASQSDNIVAENTSVADAAAPTSWAHQDFQDDEEAITTSGSTEPQFGSSLTKGNPRPAVKAGFDAFNARYKNQWRADYVGGNVKLLHGALSEPYGNNSEMASRQFLSEAHAVFGFKADLSDLAIQKNDKTHIRNHVRFQQRVGNVPLVGGVVIVHSNKDGQVTMVQSSYVPDPAIGNSEKVSEVTAKTIARNDLQQTTNVEHEPRAEKQLIKRDDKYIYIWKVVLVPKFSYWVYHIDAETGAILYKANEIQSIKTGKGNVYKNNTAWHEFKVTSKPLKNLYSTGDGYGFTGGFLWGLRADITDDNGNNPWSSDYAFLYNPFGGWLEKDNFDATQAYYHTNSNWDWWNKKVVGKYALSQPDYFGSYSMPVYVNVVGMCNAFYSPDIDGFGNPGFAFGDDASCNPNSEDLALDSDVFRHEYAHAMMDWSGFDDQFGGASHAYGRSMGEGNADFYAFLATPKDPYIADVAFAWAPDGYLRNLDSTRMYPFDVDEPGSGFPEEHYTGEIWGGYLYDVYRALKNKSIPYVFQSGYYFSVSGGHRATEADFFDAIYAQALAEQDLTGKLTLTAKVWGAMAGRGLNAARRAPYSHSTDYFGSGQAGSDAVAGFTFNFPAVTSVKTSGNTLLSGDVHEYIIKTTAAGLGVTATVTPVKNGLLNPTVRLYTLAGVLVGSMSAAGTDKATLAYMGLPIDTYVITVTGDVTAPARGYYKFKVSAK